MMLKKRIKEAVERVVRMASTKPLKVISHFDTDGITSAAIFARALVKKDLNFSLEIVKTLDENFVNSLSDENNLVFLDLASGSLEYLKDKKTDIVILDHHELSEDSKVPSNVFMANSSMHGDEKLCSAALCYLFSKELCGPDKNLASLSVIGMVGDLHDKNIGRIFSEIINDSETIVKKGLMVYPSTRPLDRALEYSSNPYIPGVSGSRGGVVNLLRDAGIGIENGKYKALYELNEDEMRRLITAVALMSAKAGKIDSEGMIGNLFLIKFFNKLEDARELSALINACSRVGNSQVGLGFCLGNRKYRRDGESVYIEYKQSLSKALKFVSENSNTNVSGKNYLIINAKDQIKDTIIGTVASILSHSPLYPEGMMIVALAYDRERIKVSARLAGRKGQNVREVLHRAVVPVGGEVGGHPNAAGCLIPKEKEKEFLGELKKVLDLEVVSV